MQWGNGKSKYDMQKTVTNQNRSFITSHQYSSPKIQMATTGYYTLQSLVL